MAGGKSEWPVRDDSVGIGTRRFSGAKALAEQKQDYNLAVRARKTMAAKDYT